MLHANTWEPISLEAEQALLGAILLNNDAYVRVCDVVTAVDFYEAIHQKIFGVAAQMIDAGQKVTLITIRAFLDDHPIGEITVGQYLARLCAEATPIVNCTDYAKVIREMADRRRIAEIARALFPTSDTDAGQLATEAIEALDAVASSTSASLPAVSMGSAMERAVGGIAKAYENGSRIIGIPTGLKDLDSKLGGLHPGHLVIIGGRPGMGKSAIASCILLNSAKKGFRSMISSLEMSAEELAERMISDTIFNFPCDKIPYSNLRTGNFHENMFQYVKDAAEMNAALPIRIEEQPSLTMSQIATRARRMKRSPEGLDLLVIDHLDLVKPSGRYQGNKVYELGEITAAAKALAKELKIPVILLCQLNRGVEQREDRRPVLSDLRSSGSIEQDADVVIFLYREEYYLQHNKPKADTPEELQWVEKMADAKKKLTAIIAKQRMGPTGPVDLFCDIASNAVRDLGERQ